MNNELFEIDEGPQKAVIEEIIKRARPGVLELRWTEEGNTETHIVTIKGPGKRIRPKN
jgi:hypothetical protein